MPTEPNNCRTEWQNLSKVKTSIFIVRWEFHRAMKEKGDFSVGSWLLLLCYNQTAGLPGEPKRLCSVITAKELSQEGMATAIIPSLISCHYQSLILRSQPRHRNVSRDNTENVKKIKYTGLVSGVLRDISDYSQREGDYLDGKSVKTRVVWKMFKLINFAVEMKMSALLCKAYSTLRIPLVCHLFGQLASRSFNPLNEPELLEFSSKYQIYF